METTRSWDHHVEASVFEYFAKFLLAYVMLRKAFGSRQGKYYQYLVASIQSSLSGKYSNFHLHHDDH